VTTKKMHLVLLFLLASILILSGCGASQKEYEALQAELTSTQAELTSVQAELTSVQAELTSVQEEYAAAESASQNEVKRLQGELDDKSKEIDRLLADIAEKARRTEKLEAELAELQKPEEEEVTPRVFGVEYLHSKGYHITLDNFAKGKGWNVIRIDSWPLTYEYLEQQGVSILYIPTVKLSYMENEIEEIVKFVENGGGLLLVATEDRSLIDEITRVFGVRLTWEYLGNDREMTVQPYHPLARDVGTLQLDSNANFLASISPPAYDVLQHPVNQRYRPIIAAGEVGAGRFIICPYYFDLNAADNSYFMRNVLYWLEQVNLP